MDSLSQSFWSEIEGAKEYDANLAKKREEDPDKYDDDYSWEDDRIEQARRVWEFWRANAEKLPHLFDVARLIAIVPISSAGVERVFSQVKFILETVGDSALEETLEVRVMERCNCYKSKH